MLKKFSEIFLKGHERSLKAKKHIIASLLYKGIQVILGLVTIRINLSYLSAEAYGVWAVISSFIVWFELLDFGLGNGLRNKFAESKATNNLLAARQYVSTTYFILFLISSAVLLVFFVSNLFIDWTTIFGAPDKYKYDVNRLIIFVFVSFSCRFVLKIITTILTADQRASYRNLFEVISKTISLVIILILLNTTNESLLYFGMVYSFVPLLVLLVASLYFYSKDYKQFRPSLKFVNTDHSKGLMNLGIKFFIIQCTILVMFSTDNMIIAHIFSAKDVTAYSLASKLFQLVWVLSTIVLNPIWPAFTEAYVKKDFSWIRKIMIKLNRLWLLLPLCSIGLILLSPIAYDYFDKNDEVIVPFSLTLAMAFWNVFATYGHIYMYFLNSTGKINLQLISSIIGAIINIPLSIFFAKYLGFGLAGVIMATTVSYSYSVIIGPIQYKLIINKKAKGIFNK